MNRKLTIILISAILLMLAYGTSRAQDCTRVLTALDQTDALIARVGPFIDGSGNADAQALYARGVNAQTSARTAYDNGECRAAFRSTQDARVAVSRALSLISERPDSCAMARDQVARLQAAYDRARPNIRLSANPRAQAVFAEGSDFLTQAGAAIEAGNCPQAFRLIRASREKLTLALRMITRTRTGDPGRGGGF